MPIFSKKHQPAKRVSSANRPIFNRRHYEVLASILSQSTNKQANLDYILIRDNLVSVLAMDNPRFDKAKFLKAANGGQ